LVAALIAPSLPARADPSVAAPAPPAPGTVDQYRPLRFSAGVSLTGIGLLSVVVGSVLGARALVSRNEIGSHCNKVAVCDLTGYTLGSEAQDFAYVSNASFVVAGLAMGAGLPLLLTALPKKSAPTAWIRLSPRGLGAVVRF
jgi:hypothetical protein